MIYIEERQTLKLPGETSLFLKFNYNKDIVDIIKDGVIPVKNFNKTTTEWEIPLTSLAYLIDKLNVYDEIDIKLLPDTKVKEQVQYQLLDYKTKPFSYQLDAIQRGLNQNSWLLLDAPGLGKTLTLIYLAQELKEKRGLEHCLIICGINTLKSNWKKEIKLHSNLSCRILGERTNRKGETVFGGTKERLADLKEKRDEFFLITNVETLRDEKIVKELNSGTNKIDCIFFDECHTCLDYNTVVNTNLGDLKLGYIVDNKVDCKVASFNHNLNQVEYQDILNYYKLNSDNILELTFQDEENNNCTIRCTEDHKIFTSNRGYIEAKDLSEFDDIMIFENKLI